MNDSLFDLATTGIQPLVMVVSASALALVALVMLASGSRRLERVQHGHVASAQTSPMCAHRQAILVGVLAISCSQHQPFHRDHSEQGCHPNHCHFGRYQSAT